MELNPILIDGFVAAIKADKMIIEQVPIPYKEEVEKRLRGDEVEQEE